MLGAIQKIGLAARSVQGWVWMLGLAAVGTSILIGRLEGVPWFYIIVGAAGLLAFLLASLYYALRLFEWGVARFTSKREQRRIGEALVGYRDGGYTTIDLPTVADIWSNTRDDKSLHHHMCFRKLKAAVNQGKIAGANLRGERKASIKTMLPVDSVIEYFRREGVIESSGDGPR